MRQKSKNRPFKIVAIIMAALLAISAAIVLNLQNITDRLTVLSFTPSESIRQLSDRSQLTDHGEFLFFASQPVLDGTQTFNDICRHNKEHRISILGCYTNSRIYIYDISDERLDGIREVTAAHEMLHAAYERMSASEKSQLRPLLYAAYEKYNNDDLAKRIKYYEESQPGQFYNELHSIVGTEFSDIGEDLESHYSEYFKDRSAIVSLYSKYQGTLKGLQDKLNTLSKGMTSQRETIDKRTASYLESVDQLNRDIEQFNIRAISGYYSSQAQFNRDRQALVVRTNNLALQQNQVTLLINGYNERVKEYNEYSALVNDLHELIDSTLAPPPSL